MCTEKHNVTFCQCNEGFRGINCDLDVNECLNSPCQNGGYCQNKIGTFNCFCPAGLTGLLCEKGEVLLKLHFITTKY